jgi:hypothetical protein
MDPESPAFPPEFDDEFPVGPRGGNRAFFGRNVLRGLIDGIDDFVELRHERWRTFHSLGPVLLGSAMWIADRQLIDKLAELAGACIVVPKQGRSADDRWRLRPLQVVNEQTPGLPIEPFADLHGLAPRVDGAAAVVGPHDAMDDAIVPTIRTIGYRQPDARPPIIHAKLALLGHIWWTDEHPSGMTGEWRGFTPRRLWVSSANFTFASRRSLEFGYWTEDPALLAGAERFLLRLIRHSEQLDPDADALDPELAPVDFDDTAMADALAELDLG